MFKQKPKNGQPGVPKIHKSSTWQSDLLGFFVFIVIVAIGVFVINLAVFRSFSVTGPSMEPTFYTGDRIIVNRLPVTWDLIQGKDYLPERGQIIVFENPNWTSGSADQYIVKRAIAYPGERVTVKDCVLKVFNQQHPDGFNPYDDIDIKQTCVSGENETTVPDRELYVVGDHNEGRYSMDSRNNLGTIPFDRIIGPVSMQLLPIDKFRFL